MINERYIIELSCIDEGNKWGLNLGQIVYFTQIGPFAISPFDATIYKTKTMPAVYLEQILDEGNFMPRIKKVTITIE